MSHPEFFGLAHVSLEQNLLRNSEVILIRLDSPPILEYDIKKRDSG